MSNCWGNSMIMIFRYLEWENHSKQGSCIFMVESCCTSLIKFSRNTVPNLYRASKLCWTAELSSCSSSGFSNIDDISCLGFKHLSNKRSLFLTGQSFVLWALGFPGSVPVKYPQTISSKISTWSGLNSLKAQLRASLARQNHVTSAPSWLQSSALTQNRIKNHITASS